MSKFDWVEAVCKDSHLNISMQSFYIVFVCQFDEKLHIVLCDMKSSFSVQSMEKRTLRLVSTKPPES